MIRTNLDWDNKLSVIKGNFAEEIVRNYLESKGFVVYEPITNGAHCFDKLAVKDKEQFIIAECKAKAKRTYYNDTGINIRSYYEYKKVMGKHKIPVFIFFIDEYLAEIYGNFLSELEKEDDNYPIYQNGIIYFPMYRMRRNIAGLTPEQCAYLKEHSNRSYEYQAR